MESKSSVPILKSFDEVYPEDALPTQRRRWDGLLSKFSDEFDGKVDFVARSPGRVNLIGEHIDYSLYSCVPMGIEADVLEAVAITPAADSDAHITLVNTNSQKYPTRTFTIPARGDIEIDAKVHEWSNYFKAGLKGAVGLLRQKRGEGFKPVGMKVVVDGSVPAGGGLSSSAAFVCASALAVMRAHGETEVDQTELVECAIVSERSVGVNSGGLDQSASVLSQRGSALQIQFHPKLVSNLLPIPQTDPPLSFLLAQSLVTSDKHVSGPVCYNLRVVEVTLAALVLARIFKLPPLPNDAGPLGVSVRGFHDAYFRANDPSVGDNHSVSQDQWATQLEQLIALVEDYLPQEEGYTREEISAILDMSIPDLEAQYMTRFPIRAERFKLRQRALHVLSEALRVQKFITLLQSATPANGNETARQLGELMKETQKSCRDDYECSCPELDQMCAIAEAHGSLGGRLTGAGWGGCSVHLVPADRVDEVRRAWTDEFYKVRWPEASEEVLSGAVVVSKPGRGSAVWEAEGRMNV